jgi:hypothetical protein
MHDLIPLADANTAIVTYANEHDALRAFAENEKVLRHLEYQNSLLIAMLESSASASTKR